MRRWRRRRRRRRQRTSGTYPERLLRRALTTAGIEFEENTRVLGMRPDIVLRALRVAVFVDGCFWHGCPRHFKVPEKNTAFWSAKIGNNRARDERQGVKLIAAGWAVVRLWEHEIRSSARKCAARVIDVLADRPRTPVPADEPGSDRDARKPLRAAKSGTRTPPTAPTTRRATAASRKAGTSGSASPNGRRKPAAPKPKKPGARKAAKKTARTVAAS